MKWRSSAVYLVVLLLMGGYYYYFEVMKKAEKDAAERQAKRAFVFDANAAASIEIRGGEAKPVHLEKGEKWRIVQPISAEVDKMAFDGFFSALQNIEQERKLGQAPESMEAFGLKQPALTIRVKTGDQWLDLEVGGKNPAESARYASAGGEVFLMPRGAFEALNKGLKDLRKKDIFSWQPDQVVSMEVQWRSGEGLKVERPAGGHEWKAEGRPDLKIKGKKVEDVLDQVHWLRAVDFLEHDAMPASALVELKLKLKDGQVSDLRIGEPDDEKKQAVASSTGFENPVRIASHIIPALPKTVNALEDRSLLDFMGADARQVTWKTDSGSGDVFWLGENKWGVKTGEGDPKPIDEPWPISGFLSDMDGYEFLDVVEPGTQPPEKANYVRFLSVDGRNGSLNWEGLPAEGGPPVTAWVEKSGVLKTVRLPYETLRSIGDSLAEMNSLVQGRKKE